MPPKGCVIRLTSIFVNPNDNLDRGAQAEKQKRQASAAFLSV
jgi:hypothetical protein